METAGPLFLVVVAGAFLQANIGFGFPIVAMIFLPSLFPFSTAVTMCQLIAMASTGYLAVRYRRQIQWKTLVPLLLPSLAIAGFVIVFSLSVQPGILKMVLGAMLVFVSLYFAVFSDRIHIEGRMRNGLLMGTLAGVGNGLFGIGGPAVALYLLPAVSEKTRYLATIQAYFFLCNLQSILIRVYNGAMVVTDIPLVLLGWVAIIVGTLLGVKTFSKIGEALLSRIVYLFVGVSGLVIVVGETVAR
jgi:uncharacterized membrane protein YfcA